MKVLTLSFNDGDNLAIENVLHELEARGHEITIFARYQDENSIRMFHGLRAEIKSIKELTPETAREFDFGFCSVNMMVHVKFLDIYFFVYSQYYKEFFMTDGADFLFAYRNGAMPRCSYRCATMQVGDSKNDHVPVAPVESSKQILFIDCGHIPFGRKGKEQVADMLLDICREHPDYELCVKPRWLRGIAVNYTHKNTEHLYTVIEERCGGNLPANLNMLNEHKNLQELIDASISVVTLYTTAIADVLLRGKGLVIASGWDCEDKWDARYMDIEYQREFFSKSGCMVNYRDVKKYLPEGLHARQEFEQMLFCCKTGASKHMVEVMEYVYENFLVRGVYPEAIDYSYETYQQQMKSDPAITMITLKQERVRDIIQQRIARQSYMLSVPIDFSRYYEKLDKTYRECSLTAGGYERYLDSFIKEQNQIIIDNAELLSVDAIDQARLLQALYDMKQEEAILALREDQVRCIGPYHYYMGLIYSKAGSAPSALEHFRLFLLEANARAYEKYIQEKDIHVGRAYSYIFRTYNGENMDPAEFADLYISFYNQRIITIADVRSRERAHGMLPKVAEQLKEINPDRAIKCLELYIKWDYHYRIKRRDEQIKSLKKDIEGMRSARLYRLSQGVKLIGKKLRGGIQCLREHGFLYTARLGMEKVLAFIHKKVDHTTCYRIWNVFHTKVMKGYELYSSFVQKYGDCSTLFLAGPGGGDTFICASMYKSYISKEGISFGTPVFGAYASASGIANLFNIEYSEKYTMEEFRQFYNLFMFDLQKGIHIKSLHYHIFYRHTAILAYLEGVRGFNFFSEEMAYLGFDCNECVSMPAFVFDEKNVLRMFAEKNLVPGKTVLLSPYSKSVKIYRMQFWEVIASKLMSLGLCVCTNSAGEEEPPIKGTTPIFIPYDYSVPFLESAGACIGVRTGFFDVINSAQCLKITLYRLGIKRGLGCSEYDSFSMIEMYHQENQHDYIYTPESEGELIDEIIQLVVSHIGRRPDSELAAKKLENPIVLK